LTIRPTRQALRAFLLLGIVGACGRFDVYAVTEPVASSSATATEGSRDAAAPSIASSPSIAATPSVSTITPAPTTSSPADAGGGEPVVPACPSPVLPAGDTVVTLNVGSVARRYLLHVPAAYDGRSPVPLIVDFHGIGNTGQSELALSTYVALTDPEGVILAFPNGAQGPLGSAWNMGPCCVEGVDDLAFARALVEHVQASACIDPDRVYATGVLTGGGMVHYLACEAADLFAAAAPAAFDLLQETVDDCKPARPITVVSFRGTEDTRVPYEGGLSSLVPGMPITFLGAAATFERWASINGCEGEPSAEDANGCATYANCAGGVEVVLCTSVGGREEPPDATIAWPILKRYTR
jgi:polyhydroxybutyrate depolymerase